MLMVWCGDGGGGSKPPRGPVTPVLRKKGSGPVAYGGRQSESMSLLVVVRGDAGAPCELGGVVVAVRTLKKPPGEKVRRPPQMAERPSQGR